MALEILAGLIVAASFPAGVGLFKMAREEIEPFAKKIKLGFVFAMLIAAVLGIVSSVIGGTSVLALSFAVGLATGSFLLPAENQKRQIRNAAITAIVYLATYLIGTNL